MNGQGCLKRTPARQPRGPRGWPQYGGRPACLMQASGRTLKHGAGRVGSAVGNPDQVGAGRPRYCRGRQTPSEGRLPLGYAYGAAFPQTALVNGPRPRVVALAACPSAGINSGRCLVAPLQGSIGSLSPYPGRCPGLVCRRAFSGPDCQRPGASIQDPVAGEVPVLQTSKRRGVGKSRRAWVCRLLVRSRCLEMRPAPGARRKSRRGRDGPPHLQG